MNMSIFKICFSFLGRVWSRIDDVFSAVAGLPSYDEYVKHAKKKHPDKPILSKKEFIKSIQNASTKRPRCC